VQCLSTQVQLITICSEIVSGPIQSAPSSAGSRRTPRNVHRTDVADLPVPWTGHSLCDIAFARDDHGHSNLCLSQCLAGPCAVGRNFAFSSYARGRSTIAGLSYREILLEAPAIDRQFSSQCPTAHVMAARRKTPPICQPS